VTDDTGEEDSINDSIRRGPVAITGDDNAELVSRHFEYGESPLTLNRTSMQSHNQYCRALQSNQDYLNIQPRSLEHCEFLAKQSNVSLGNQWTSDINEALVLPPI